MKLYAVALSNPGAYAFGDEWIEFYWADDRLHAEEQAEDANASARILAVAEIPYEVVTPER